jgi:hypothetical protein
MKKTLHVMLLGLLLSLSGCAFTRTITHSQPYLITIKTPQMAFSDTGFLNEAENYTQLQIFSAGTAVLNLEMSDTICLDGTCLDTLAFNTRFFGTEHYAQILHDIVHKKPLYDGRNLEQDEGAFSQNIELPNTSIHYKIKGDERYFKDTKNGILIRLKPLS